MLISTPLNCIPFISSSDSTRLQMSAKQMAQSLTHANTTAPHVISSDWPFVSETSKLFKKVAPNDGEVIYTNIDLMIIVYLDNNSYERIEVCTTPPYMETANSFASSLRHRRSVGPFNKNDILYEYDCFNNGVPSYGYNANTLFMPFFGYNFEDSIIISESLAKKAIGIKYKKVYVNIYYRSLYKSIYPNSKYRFIPEIGQKINGNIITSQVLNKSNLNLYSYGDLIDDDLQLTSDALLCRLENAEVVNIKIHRADGNKTKKLLDDNLEKYVYKVKEDYAVKIKQYSEDFKDCVGPMTRDILTSNYVMQSNKGLDINLDDLAYVIELELKKEYETKPGDKMANRFANKGIVNLILPDDLCPINLNSGERIDIILGPLGIYSRISKIGAFILRNMSKNYVNSVKVLLIKFNI